MCFIKSFPVVILWGAFASPTQETVSLENDGFEPFQNGRPLHRSMWCLETTQPFSRNSRQRSKSTVLGGDHFTTISTPIAPPTQHNNHHTCSRYLRPLYNVTKNTAPPPIAPRHFPHTSTGRPPTTTITVHDACDRSRASQKNIAHTGCNSNCNLQLPVPVKSPAFTSIRTGWLNYDVWILWIVGHNCI